jgi:hypothetical protein
VFGEKRTQKLSPGLIKDQHGLLYFFSRSLLNTTMTSILIQYGGRMQIIKMGLILPYAKSYSILYFHLEFTQMHGRLHICLLFTNQVMHVNNPGNYRGIAIDPCLGKLFNTVK